MRGRILLPYLVGMAFCSLATAADWTLIPHQNDDKLQAVFIDKESISVDAGITKAWFLFNYSTPKNNRQSEKQLVHFKCNQKRMLRQLIHYEDAAGDGKVVDTFVMQLDPHNYREIAPDSLGSAILKAACAPTAKLPATAPTRADIKQKSKEPESKRM